MNAIQKLLSACLFGLLVPVVASAQLSKIPQRLEIVTLETEIVGITEVQEVFNMPKDSVNHYYLSVGHLGIGDDVIQIQFDPVFELFIPLGNTLDEAIETMKKLQELYTTAPGTSIEMSGIFSAAWPSGDPETVKITRRKVLLSNLLEFSLEREGYIRATHLSKMDFNSLLNGVKFYKKIHPKE